jgi:hypothetical protein
MAGQIEGEDAVPRFDKRFDEDAQVCTAAAPAMHQVHRRALSPGLPCDEVSGPRCLDRLTRGDARRHAQTHLHSRRGAPQFDGPFRPDCRCEPLEKPERPAHLRCDRWLDAGARLTRSAIGSHRQSPLYYSRVSLSQRWAAA